MARYPISMFFLFLALVAAGIGAAAAHAVSLGPCLGDAECVAQG